MKKQLLYLILLISIFFSLGLFGTSVSGGQLSDSNLEISQSFTPYKFIALGDTRPEEGDNTGLETIVDLIENIQKSHQIEFILHSGDMVEHGADQSDWDTYYWPLMADLEAEIPIYYTVGNHEYYSRGTGGYNLSLITYLNNVENPGNEIYYSFNSPQNDTHFIVLNTDYVVGDIDEDATKAAEQHAWLENELKNESYDRTIIMTHRPLWGLNPADDRIQPVEELQALWHPLFVENGVDMVISGHAHNFYQTVRNGTDYTTAGGGTIDYVGAQPDHPNVKPTLLPEDRIMLETLHLCLIEATLEGFDVDVIAANGTVVFEYLVPAILELEETTTTTTTIASSTTTTREETTFFSFPGVILAIFLMTVVFSRRQQLKR